MQEAAKTFFPSTPAPSRGEDEAREDSGWFVVPSLLRQGQDIQAHLMTRHRLAALASGLVVSLFLVMWAGEAISGEVAIRASGMVISLVILFFVLFKTRLNKAFSDPSMTALQIASASGVIAYVTFAARGGHNAAVVLYIMPLLFGALRYSQQQLLRLAMMMSAFDVLARTAWFMTAPTTPDIGRELAAWLALTVVLAWFSLMVGYLGDARKKATTTSSKLRESLVRAESLASEDELTRAYTRRHMRRLFEQEKARMERGQGAYTIALADIDHFKGVNDRFGHPVGDAVLKAFADAARAAVRTADTVGRYGGEEFILLFPATGVGGAAICAERLRASVQAMDLSMIHPALKVTVSLGVAEACTGESIDEVIARADAALYRAKHGGRNRVEVADESAARAVAPVLTLVR